MSFKDKFNKYFQDSYFEKYGDRIASTSGTVVSIKFTEKNYILFHRLIVDMVIKPEIGKAIVKARYKKNRWFKKVDFIPVNVGHKVMIMGLKGIKGKKDSEVIAIQNVLNLTTKRDLVPVDHSQIKKSRQQAGRMRY
ncbi:hypothetical protein [uncultured Clostridium sp.]|uniref:hypothetical protein n=1 Tax=uncultured Clostridium sp. TaxID=59620 RepID=UPI0025E63521|nr:hypothetical protein [uncultured Clostridium sp.]